MRFHALLHLSRKGSQVENAVGQVVNLSGIEGAVKAIGDGHGGIF